MTEQSHPYPNFLRALIELADSDERRAEIIGVHRHTVRTYRLGTVAPKVARIAHVPSLLAAYAEDIAAKTHLCAA